MSLVHRKHFTSNSKMKVVFCAVLLLTTFAMAFGDSPEAELMRKAATFNAECQRKSGINAIQLLEISMMRVPDNRKVYCYMACIAKNLGMMTADNKFTKEGIIQLASPFQEKYSQGGIYQSAENIVETCIAEQIIDTDECNAAKTAITCVLTKGKQAGLIH